MAADHTERDLWVDDSIFQGQNANMGYDIRALANFVLDRADELGRPITNVHINKVLFFCHVWFLVSSKKKLTNAKIEAWDYGPVFREVYQSFKQSGALPIRHRAKCLDLQSGEFVICESAISADDREFLIRLIDSYTARKPFDLVELTHEKGTPWDKVYHHDGRSNPGMTISDDLIVDYYSSATKQ